MAGHDIRYKTPFTNVIGGSSQSGKTMHTRNTLINMDKLFTSVPDYIIFCYSQWQDIFSAIANDTIQIGCDRQKPSPPESYEEVRPPQAKKRHIEIQTMKRKRENNGEVEQLQGGGGVEADVNNTVCRELEPRRPVVNEWIQELPTTEMLQQKLAPFKDGNGSLIVIDDFASDLTKDIADLFTVTSHALNCSVILLTQNIFAKNKYWRTISLNSMYITLFKNARDQSQIINFGKQFSPYDVRWVVDAFRECTKRPYTYCLYDSTQSSPDIIRVRSGLLPGEDGPRIWVRNEKQKKKA